MFFFVPGISFTNRKLASNEFVVKDFQGNDQSIFVSIHQEYVSIMKIPFWAKKKRVNIHDKNGEKDLKLSPTAKEQIDSFISSVKTPKLSYLGFYALFILLLGGVGLVLFDNAQQDKYIVNPQRGDVYIVERNHQGVSHYSFIKVRNVKDDNVCVSQNVMQYSAYVSSIDLNDGFFDFCDDLSQKEIQKMYDTGVIRRVERDWSVESGFGQEVEIQDRIDPEQIISDDRPL